MLCTFAKITKEGKNEKNMKCFVGLSSKVIQKPMSAFVLKLGAAWTNETPFVMWK